MIRYTKIGADGSDLPADAEGHQVVRVEHDLLARPIFVANVMPPKGLTHEQARKWAAALTIYDWSWRLAIPEEGFMVPDRSRKGSALDPVFFSNIDADNYFWLDTEAAFPAGYAWDVYLDDGLSYRLRQDSHLRALAVRAGQF